MRLPIPGFVRRHRRSRPLAFTIAGYYGFGNIGDEAILESMLADLRREFEGAHFEILCAGYAPTAQGGDITQVRWTDWRRVIRSVENCDLLIVGGGGIFNSYLDYRPEDLLAETTYFAPFIFGIPLLGRLLGKPVCIYGIGAGGFNLAEALRHARMAVKVATVCTVRDFASKTILEPTAPAGGGIRVTADPAFRLENADARAVASRLDPELAADLRRTIAVVVRNWSFSSAPGAWEPAIALGLKDFAARRRLPLLFIPFQISQDTPFDLNNDSSAIERVRAALGDMVSSWVLPAEFSAAEISALLGECGMVLGMRLHASILAVRNAVPFVGLAYEGKVWNVLTRCGLERFVMDPDGITSEALLAALERVFAESGQIRKELKRAAEQMARAAYENVRAVREALAGAGAGAGCDADCLPFLQELALKQTLLLAARDEEVRSMRAELEAHRRDLRSAIEQRSFGPALQQLNQLLVLEPENAEWLYLKAFCLHSLGRDLPLARDCYGRALAGGFDEFWVRYHRGQLSLRMGQRDEALADLERALEINPDHAGLAELLASLRPIPCERQSSCAG